MKKYLTAFFTFLGYVAFISLLGAGIVIYMGHRKSLAAQSATMTTTDGQVVSMHPQKQTDTATTLPQTLTHFQPISRKPVSASKPKTVRTKTDNKPTRMAPPVSVAPVTYAAKKTAPAATASRQVATAKKTSSARPVKSKAKHSPTAPHADLGLPSESTLAFRVTDNGANPRTGRGIVNVYETTDLERQVARRLEDLQQLKEAAEQIRNPPVHESGIMKLLSGNK